MSNKDERNYKKDHTDAKAIVCTLVIIILMISKYVVFPISLILESVAVIIWFFGVNFMARVLERIRRHKEKHDWI